MSEYQYFEWQTLDRPLSAEEEAAVNGLSSHIDVTPTRGWVEYHWSGFKHDPKQVLVRYFDAFLRRLAEEEPLLSLKFNRRLQELAGPPAKLRPAKARRTWGELRETAERLRREDEQRLLAEAEARRIKDLQDSAPGAAKAWRDVQALIEQKQARPYDEAVALLVKLSNLAIFQQQQPEFEARLRSLQTQYANRPAFQERLRKAGLG